jgi:hypothetical protein
MIALVGYESDIDLEEMRTIGFETTGLLRIWERKSA